MFGSQIFKTEIMLANFCWCFFVPVDKRYSINWYIFNHKQLSVVDSAYYHKYVF